MIAANDEVDKGK